MSTAPLNTPFLGQCIEICIVTADLRKTLSGLVQLGIGPFQIYNFNSSTVKEMTYEGESTDFEVEVAFAQPGGKGSMIWEVMRPVRGPSVMQEFLDQTNGRGGIQHVCFDCGDGNEANMTHGGELEARQEAVRRRELFEKRGFSLKQSGVWKGKRGTVHFMYFDTMGAINTCFESYVFSADWEDPEEVETFPTNP